MQSDLATPRDRSGEPGREQNSAIVTVERLPNLILFMFAEGNVKFGSETVKHIPPRRLAARTIGTAGARLAGP